ncbi:MAG TPA: VOC family protein [Chloroflexota bacterium]|nr:VOC family protein [Chloroflexota bacterium]
MYGGRMTVKPQFGFVIEYVQDTEAATRFYVDVMGLLIERTHPTFVQFQNFAIASDEPLGGTRRPELYWLVEDAQAAYNEMSGTAEVSLPLQQLPFGTVFGIKDPDGHARYLVQLAANRPSQPLG